jgi:putative endonuclease
VQIPPSPPRQTWLSLDTTIQKRGSPVRLGTTVVYLIIFKAASDAALMHYYVYILRDKNNKLYVGFSSNLKRRLHEHATGRVISTKNRRFLRLVHYEYFINKKDAKQREIYLKSGFGRQQVKSFLKKTLKET